MSKNRATGRKHTRETVNGAIAHRGLELMQEYTVAAARCIFKCRCGYLFESSPHAVLYLDRGCPKCPTTKIRKPTGRKEDATGRRRNRSYFGEGGTPIKSEFMDDGDGI